jgi:hypothetical protein
LIFDLLLRVPLFEDVRRVVWEREKMFFFPSFCLFVCSLCFLRCERLLRFHPFLLTNCFSFWKGWMKLEMGVNF